MNICDIVENNLGLIQIVSRKYISGNPNKRSDILSEANFALLTGAREIAKQDSVIRNQKQYLAKVMNNAIIDLLRVVRIKTVELDPNLFRTESECGFSHADFYSYYRIIGREIQVVELLTSNLSVELIADELRFPIRTIYRIIDSIRERIREKEKEYSNDERTVESQRRLNSFGSRNN